MTNQPIKLHRDKGGTRHLSFLAGQPDDGQN
jgi:hypothetical protein